MDARQVPTNDVIFYPAFLSYQVSPQTAALKSEQDRKFVAESFETKGVLPLSTLCVQSLGQNYEKRQFPIPDLSVLQQRVFYDQLSDDMPIRKCVKIDDVYYWKRVYNNKCTDKMLLREKNRHEDTPWKSLVLTLKYLELIENTPYEFWQTEEMEAISKIVAPYVYELDIKKLQQKSDEAFRKTTSLSDLSQQDSQSQSPHSTRRNTATENENDKEDEDEEVEEPKNDFPFQECHHANLSIVRFLENLNSFSIEYAPPKLEFKYHTRYYNFSYVDIQCLASGISNLQNLKTFKIRRSRMDVIKLSTILSALQSIPIENVDFYFCQLTDDCGEALYEFLLTTKTLKHLDLSGNYFKGEAVVQISDGIAKSPCELAYLALSNNPIGDDSLCHLLNIVATYKPLEVLKLSGIQSSEVGAACLAKMVKKNVHLAELHIIAVELEGAEFVAAMKINYKLQQCFCQACGLTFDQEFKVEVFLRRNRYMKAHPYIGNIQTTNEEIDKFLSGIRDPIFMKALEDRALREKCSGNKPLNDMIREILGLKPVAPVNIPEPVAPVAPVDKLEPHEDHAKHVHI